MMTVNTRKKFNKHHNNPIKPIANHPFSRVQSPPEILNLSPRDQLLNPRPDKLKRNTLRIDMLRRDSETLPNDKLLPLPLRQSKSDKKLNKNSAEFSIQEKNTPPNIKKIEKFWKKFGELNGKSVECEIKETTSSRVKKAAVPVMGNGRVLGVPARFKDITFKKAKNHSKEKLLLSKGLEEDLYIIKANSTEDLRYRVEIAKLARIYEENNKEGILKKKKSEGWRWSTPAGTPVDKTVKFDFDVSQNDC